MQIDAPLLHIAHSAALSKPQHQVERNFARWQRRLHGSWAVARSETRYARNFPCHAQDLLSDQPVAQTDAQK
jgi:hypothetical protein